MRKNINIIQSKLTNNITNKYNKQIWEEITKYVNAVGKANRTVQEVKDKWENLHSTEKKTNKQNRRNVVTSPKMASITNPLPWMNIFLLGNNIVSINDSFIFALCSLPLWLHTASTLMGWNPFRLTKSFSFVLGAWILTCVPSTLPITPGNPPLSWKPSLDYLQFGGRRPQNELFLLLGQSKQHIFHHPWDRGFWQADGVTDGS